MKSTQDLEYITILVENTSWKTLTKTILEAAMASLSVMGLQKFYSYYRLD